MKQNQIFTFITLVALLLSGCSAMLQSRIEAQSAYTCSVIRSLNSALEIYRLDVGEYPSSLDNLLKNPGNKNWNGPYIAGDVVPRDAWGNPFRYEIIDTGPVVGSPGPDGIWGSQDDIFCR